MKNKHIDPDGTTYYRGSIGWFTVKEVAEQYGYIEENAEVVNQQPKEELAKQKESKVCDVKSLLNQIVVTAAFRDKSKPQELWRSIYQTLDTDPLNIVTTKSGKKTSKLDTYISRGLLSSLLEASLKSLRKHNNFKNRMNRDNLQTGSNQTVNLDGHRLYSFENRTYPSVTTILKHTNTNDIQKYILKGENNLVEKIGLKKTIKFTSLYTKVGNYTHSVIEAFLLGLEGSDTLLERSLAKHLKPSVFDNIKRVLACELPVCHSTFKYAGAIDAVVEDKDGKVILLDWKTSLKVKTNSGIINYKKQTAAYALAYFAEYGVVVDEVKICVMYRQTIGKRKPRRHDIFTMGRNEIKNYVESFLDNVESYYHIFPLEKEENVLEEVPW